MNDNEQVVVNTQETNSGTTSVVPKQLKIPIGVGSFIKIRRTGTFYIDKTRFIYEWLNRGEEITLITRGRRFCKTLTKDMMVCFLSTQYAGRRDLFEGLEISRYPELMELQGTMPVISLSFAGVKAKTLEEFVANLISTIGEAYEAYATEIREDSNPGRCGSALPFFEDGTDKIEKLLSGDGGTLKFCNFQIQHGIKWLSAWLYRRYKKDVYIFLDEYDTPLQTAYVHGYYDQALEIMSSLLEMTFKDNEYLERAMITGITGIVKESLFSDMNSATEFSVMDDQYSDIFGFTKREVADSCRLLGLEDKMDTLARWYEGYTIGHTTGIYNPWSVLNYFAKRPSEPQAYWTTSGGTKLLDSVLKGANSNIQQKLTDLLLDKTIAYSYNENLNFSDLQSDEESVWTLMISAGYLKAAWDENGNRGLSLVNLETKIGLESMIKKWFNKTKKHNLMTDFADAFEKGDVDSMQMALIDIVDYSISFYDSARHPPKNDDDIRPENFFHGLVLGMLSCLSPKYIISSNLESGFVRFDLALEPKDRVAIPSAGILEFKVFSSNEKDKTVDDTARRARNQIEAKHYDQTLLGRGFDSDHIQKYGIGFKGKEVMIVA